MGVYHANVTLLLLFHSRNFASLARLREDVLVLAIFFIAVIGLLFYHASSFMYFAMLCITKLSDNLMTHVYSRACVCVCVVLLVICLLLIISLLCLLLVICLLWMISLFISYIHVYMQVYTAVNYYISPIFLF